MTFLYFKGIIHAYLLKMSIAHQNLNALLNLLINCISAKSASQMVSIKDDCTFLSSNFLVIGLCNSYANSLLDIISFLTIPSEVFLTKHLLTIEASPR